MTWLWPTIIFVVVLYVLLTKAAPPIRKLLADRADGIRQALESARRERAEAEALLVKYREQIDRVKRETDEILAEGRRDAEVLKSRVASEARAESEAMVARARREIQLATDTAVKSLYDKTADIAVDLAAEIMRRELSADDHRKLVSESIRRMEAAKN